MDNSEILALADNGVKTALSKGVDQVEIWLESATEISISLERNDLSSGSSTKYSGMGIRVVSNNSVGFVCLNRISPKYINQAIKDAIDISNYAPPNKYNSLPPCYPIQSIDVYDPESESFGVDNALEMGCEILDVVKEYDSRVVIDMGSFSAMIGTQAICTSEGVTAAEKSSVFIWQLLGMALESDQVGSYATSFDATTKTKNISVSQTAKDFAKEAIHSLQTKKIESFKGSLILTPLSAAEFILSPLIFSSNADNIQKGRSQFSQKRGALVVSDCLTIIDDGTIPSAIGSGAFDREGVPHSPIKIIEDGIFLEPLYNTLSSNREQRESNGHAIGSYRTIPSIGPTNLILKGSGEALQPYDTIINDINEGIIVNRFSGEIDPISGFFSGVIKGGQYILKGERRHPISSITIQGNIFESLVNSVRSISKETKRLGSWIFPELIELADFQFISGTDLH